MKCRGQQSNTARQYPKGAGKNPKSNYQEKKKGKQADQAGRNGFTLGVLQKDTDQNCSVCLWVSIENAEPWKNGDESGSSGSSDGEF